MDLIPGIDQSKVAFGTDLGVATATCNHRDVSGTRRFKYFTSALPLHSGLCGEFDGDAENLDLFVEQHEKSPPIYLDAGTQTNTPVPRKLSLDEERVIFMAEMPELVRIHQERGQLEVERRKQMAKIPAKTEEKAWAESLEENRKKDCALREQELDLVIQHKIILVKKDLYKEETHENKDEGRDSNPGEIQRNEKGCSIICQKDRSRKKVGNDLDLSDSNENNRGVVQRQQNASIASRNDKIANELIQKSTWKTCAKRYQRRKVDCYDAKSAREEKDHSKDLALISSIFEKKCRQ